MLPVFRFDLDLHRAEGVQLPLLDDVGHDRFASVRCGLDQPVRADVEIPAIAVELDQVCDIRIEFVVVELALAEEGGDLGFELASQLLVGERLIAGEPDAGDFEPIALKDSEQHEPGVAELVLVDRDACVVVSLLAVQLLDASSGSIDLESVDRGARHNIDNRGDLRVVDLLVPSDLDIRNDASLKDLEHEGDGAVVVDAGINLNAREGAESVQSTDVIADQVGIEHDARLRSGVIDGLLAGAVAQGRGLAVDFCRTDIHLSDDPVLVEPQIVRGDIHIARGIALCVEGGGRDAREECSRDEGAAGSIEGGSGLNSFVRGQS